MNKANFALIGLAAVGVSQFGCSTADVVGAQMLKSLFKADPTVVEATIRVAKDVNPDSRDRPSPIKTRFYLLKSPNVLQSTGFFELKEQDRELLSGDLKLRDEKVFKPGAEAFVELRLPADDTAEDERLFLGVVAGYWNLDNSRWQAVQEIEVEKTTKVVVDVQRYAVSIKPAEK